MKHPSKPKPVQTFKPYTIYAFRCCEADFTARIPIAPCPGCGKAQESPRLFQPSPRI